MEVNEARDLLEGLKMFDLPEAFDAFNGTRTEPLMEGVTLTFRIPNSIDLEWATSEAHKVAIAKSALAYSYIPRIMAATLVKINDVPLHKWVKTKHEDVRIGLDEKMRRTLDYPAYVDTHRWVFENITGTIPFDLLRAVYENGLADWMDSAGGLLIIPTDGELEQQAVSDLKTVVDAAGE